MTILFPRWRVARPRSKTTSSRSCAPGYGAMCSHRPTTALTPTRSTTPCTTGARRSRSEPTGTADVVDTVNFARERNLLVAVQGRWALRGRSVELRRRHRDRPHADAGRDRRPGVPAGLGPGRRGLGRRRPRNAGVRPRRARRRRVRDGRRRPHPRRRRGLGAAQVRAHHRQPPLGRRSSVPTGRSTWRPPTTTRTCSGRSEVAAGTSVWSPTSTSTPTRSARSWPSPA